MPAGTLCLLSRNKLNRYLITRSTTTDGEVTFVRAVDISGFYAAVRFMKKLYKKDFVYERFAKTSFNEKYVMYNQSRYFALEVSDKVQAEAGFTGDLGGFLCAK